MYVANNKTVEKKILHEIKKTNNENENAEIKITTTTPFYLIHHLQQYIFGLINQRSSYSSIARSLPTLMHVFRFNDLRSNRYPIYVNVNFKSICYVTRNVTYTSAYRT